MTFPRPEFMRRALALARRGLGRTAPNPAVGAVIVRGNTVVGEGFHRAAGQPHAEVEALRDAGRLARGADLYVTLEPCCHAGRTGACTDGILAAGIRRVAAALVDPDPRVSGGGIRALEREGVEVVAGLLEAQARGLNRGHLTWNAAGRPHVTLKLALSLDGQIGASGGASRWITAEAARRMVHRLRSESDAVLIGGRTLREDDPELSARIPRGRDPRPVVLTSRPGAVVRSRLFRGRGAGLLVVLPAGSDPRGARRLREAGVRVLTLPAPGGRIGARRFLSALGDEGIRSLLVEGGGRTAGWLIAADAVDRYLLFYAPRLLGEGVRAVAGFSVRRVGEGRALSIARVRRVGTDLLVEAEPERG